MAKVVGIHGIAHQLSGEDVLHQEWLPALRSGLRRAGIDRFEASDLFCAFYGDLFRRADARGVGIPRYDASDVTDPWEQELLHLWWAAAAAVDRNVVAPDAATRGRTQRFVQRALDALSHSAFFAGIAERMMISRLKQVRDYLHDPDKHQQILARVEQAVANDTRVIIGHSLGSVVAYEVLCAHPEWPVETLVTLGSPLGIRNLIFEQLTPPPHNGVGCWPGQVRQWVNIADNGDIVALVKALRLQFGERVEDRLVYNGATAHQVVPYLTAQETGAAIASGLV
jgi:pimeloyl-ACP methyl ester carboxylesterase